MTSSTGVYTPVSVDIVRSRALGTGKRRGLSQRSRHFTRVPLWARCLEERFRLIQVKSSYSFPVPLPPRSVGPTLTCRGGGGRGGSRGGDRSAPMHRSPGPLSSGGGFRRSAITNPLYNDGCSDRHGGRGPGPRTMLRSQSPSPGPQRGWCRGRGGDVCCRDRTPPRPPSSRSYHFSHPRHPSIRFGSRSSSPGGPPRSGPSLCHGLFFSPRPSSRLPPSLPGCPYFCSLHITLNPD